MQAGKKVWSGLLLSFVLCGASSAFGQSLGERARQERERRAQSAHPTHVYTNEDLARPEILAPEDRARFEAAQPAPVVSPTQTERITIDATVPQDASIEVAPKSFIRSLQKEPKLIDITTPPARAHKRATASRKHENMRAGIKQPAVRRASRVSRKPVVHPETPVIASPISSRIRKLGKRLAAVRRTAKIRARVGRPSISRAASLHHKTIVHKEASVVASTSRQQTLSDTVIVRPGDSLWKLATQYLNNGNNWLKIAASNPDLSDPNHLVPGQTLRIPAPEAAPSAQQVKVQKGDSLWKMAVLRFGHGQAWSCIASANPQVKKDILLPGQLLTIPTNCANEQSGISPAGTSKLPS